MLIAKVNDVKLFIEFLNVINKFVQQCQFNLSEKLVNVYCANSAQFSSSRLNLVSDVITLQKNDITDNVKVCIRDVMAFKSAMSIIEQTEELTELNLNLENVEYDGNILIKSIKYKSKNGKFNLITVDPDVISAYVSKPITGTYQKHLIFNIDPKNLDILQNRTNNIINLDEVSVYITPDKENNKIIMSLESKNSPSTNSITLSIANSYEGDLDNFPYKDIAIHESSFRILNILKVTDEKMIKCFFNKQINCLFVNSAIKNNTGHVIKATVIIQMIQGK